MRDDDDDDDDLLPTDLSLHCCVFQLFTVLEVPIEPPHTCRTTCTTHKAGTSRFLEVRHDDHAQKQQ